MDQDDAEKRISELESQLAEKRPGDLGSTHDDADTAFPAQTPDYQKRERRKTIWIVAMSFTAIVGLAIGIFVFDYGFDREDGAAHDVMWLGVAIVLLIVLTPLILLIRAVVKAKRQRPLRELGTIELLSVATNYRFLDESYGWELTSEMAIRLDSGHICRGIYLARVEDAPLREWWWRAFPPDKGRLRRRITPREALEAWFYVGAEVRCLFNPRNPDKVTAFPFAATGDRLTYKTVNSAAAGQLEFESAT